MVNFTCCMSPSKSFPSAPWTPRAVRAEKTPKIGLARWRGSHEARHERNHRKPVATIYRQPLYASNPMPPSLPYPQPPKVPFTPIPCCLLANLAAFAFAADAILLGSAGLAIFFRFHAPQASAPRLLLSRSGAANSQHVLQMPERFGVALPHPQRHLWVFIAPTPPGPSFGPLSRNTFPQSQCLWPCGPSLWRRVKLCRCP